MIMGFKQSPAKLSGIFFKINIYSLRSLHNKTRSCDWGTERRRQWHNKTVMLLLSFQPCAQPPPANPIILSVLCAAGRQRLL